MELISLNYLFISVAVLISYCLITNQVYAQQEQGVSFHGDAHLVYEDNLLKQPQERSDFSLIIRPGITAIGRYNQHQFSAKFKGSKRIFNRLSDFNYSEANMLADAVFNHSEKLSSEVSVQFDRNAEDLSNINAVTANFTEFTILQRNVANIRLDYGTYSSTGMFSVSFRHEQNAFKNNGQDFRDTDQNILQTVFYYRNSDKSRLFLEFSTADIRSKNQELFDLSGSNNFFQAGVEWKVTAKTTGNVRFGYQDRNFDTSSNFIDNTGFSYAANITWKPSQYNQIKLKSSRRIADSAQFNIGTVINEDVDLQLIHSIDQDMQLTAEVGYLRLNIEEENGRLDERYTFRLNLIKQINRWLNIEIGGHYQHRDSDNPLFEFDSSAVQIGIVTKFG